MTMPHKTAVADACDELRADAAASAQRQHRLARAPTARARRRLDRRRRLPPRRSPTPATIRSAAARVVLGAGGAARAVALALGRAGADVTIAARRADAAADAATLVGARAAAWPDRDALAASAALVVNATPIGMPAGGRESEPGELAFAAAVLGAGQTYVDLVYHAYRAP